MEFFKGLIIGISIWLFFRMVLIPALERMSEKKRKNDPFIKKLREGLKESVEELKLLNSNDIPSDEHIMLYYKMYLKKWEIEHGDKADVWETDMIKPESFDNWEKYAKVEGGYKYIIPMTMDMMIGLPPNATFSRFRDYKRMVENEN